jgi:ABC-type transport system substrate-binding protein
VIEKTYDQGGFDILFTGYTMGTDADPSTFYQNNNYYLWNDSYNDALCYNITHTYDPTLRLQYIHQWQEYAYNWTPSVTLYYSKEVVAFKPSFQSAAFQNNCYPRWPGVEQWNDTLGWTNVTIAQTNPVPNYGLVPYLSGLHLDLSFYGPNSDLTIYGPIFGELGGFGMLMRSQSMAMVPYMAYGNYTTTNGGRNWTFWIRPGITFQDGTPLDGRDFVYTTRYMMTPGSGSAISGAYAYIPGIICGPGILAGIAAGYGNRTVYWAGETGTPGASLPLNYYEVHVDEYAPWAKTESDIGGLAIVPAEVLVNSSSGVPNYNAWDASNAAILRTTSFNTGTSATYVYYDKSGSLMPARTGPFGAGPFQWVDYNSGTSTVHEQKFNGYWRRAALEAAGVYKFTDYYIRSIYSATNAIAALQSNSVQVLGSQYGLENYLSSLLPALSSYVSYDGFAAQEMGFNLRHPIWGTGLGTPLGMVDPSRAAEAAWHVRRGIEYLVPKDFIIKQLLNGIGTYGITTPITRVTLGFDSDIIPRNYTYATARLLAKAEFEAAGYTFEPPPYHGPWENYGLFITMLGLAAIVVLAGFCIFRPRKMQAKGSELIHQ